jgi:single-strand DNA-binding protein
MNNNINVIGHVGQAPKTRTFASGNKVVRFSLAVKEYSNGKDEPQTMWIDVQAWNGLGEKAESLITKGRELSVQGRLAIEEYTDSKGVEIRKPVINMTGFHLHGKKPILDLADEFQLEAEKPVKKSKKAVA